MILGLLARLGPLHGHRIRREAEVTNVGNWGGVNVGALYREIGRMESEGLIEAVGTEQEGSRPPRTVYRITEAGARTLSLLREEAIRALRFGPDAFGVAMVFGRTWERKELLRLLKERSAKLAEAFEGVKAEGDRLLLKGLIGPLDLLMFDRRKMQLDAELRWNDGAIRVLTILPPPPIQSEVVDTPEESGKASPPKGSPDTAQTPRPTRRSKSQRGEKKRRKA